MAIRPWRACPRPAALGHLRLDSILRSPLIGRLSPRLILMYHGISGRDAEDSLTVRFSEFVRQIDFVADRCELVSLPEILAGDRKRPAAAITIDDGYAALLDEAMPFLLDRGVPVTLFVPFGLLGKSLVRAGNNVRLMTAAEVQDVAKAGCAVGSHSLTHRELPTLTDDEALKEIRDSRSALEELVRHPISAFSYPRGKFAPRHADMVRRSGYTYAVITANRAVAGDTDPFLLPRLRVDAATTWTKFRLKLTTLGDRYVRLRDRISR